MITLELDQLHNFIEKYNINLLNLIFVGFTTIIVFVGSLISLVEQRLPIVIQQSFRYGKHCHKGAANPLVSRLEVPKGWFKHFYIFAFTWSCLVLFLVLKGFILNSEAPECVLTFLDFMAGGRANRHVQVDSTCALVATVLMTMQCTRRFYETNFVQIFSKNSKINLSHYIVGYIHYFAVVLALISNTEGFVRGTLPSTFSFTKISLLQYLCIFIFHFSWTQQYKSNMILVSLRTDSKTGLVLHERHMMPRGGFFEMISSPHMFFETVMYMMLMALQWNNTTWYLIAFWVLCNQAMNALLTHKWYIENFKSYPKNRRAIIPFIF